MGDIPLPPDTKIKWMRIIQLIPQMRTQINGQVIRFFEIEWAEGERCDRCTEQRDRGGSRADWQRAGSRDG